MNTDEINGLLEKYWEARTTLQEESELKSYFNSGEVNEEFEQYEPLFKHFSMEKKIQSPPVNIPLISADREPKLVSMRRVWNVAAVFLPAIVSIFLIRHNAINFPDKKATVVNVDNPEEALEYTMQALAMMSSNYNKGASRLSTGMQKLDEIDIIK